MALMLSSVPWHGGLKNGKRQDDINLAAIWSMFEETSPENDVLLLLLLLLFFFCTLQATEL